MGNRNDSGVEGFFNRDVEDRLKQREKLIDEIRNAYEIKDAREKDARENSGGWKYSRVFSVGFLLMLMFSFGSTHYDVGYKERFSDTRIVSRTTVWVDYDNARRFSTYDYRHGYSYRATRDYFEDRYFGDRYFDSGVRGARYEYVSHLRSYERQDCYVTPPADRLFYVKC